MTMDAPSSGINPDLHLMQNFLLAVRLPLLIISVPKRSPWRGGRVVYGSSLENWRGFIPTVGSNPTLSAILFPSTLNTSSENAGGRPLP